MSYDLMVFEKTQAPSTKLEFMEWYELQTSWNEEHDYQDSRITSISLRNWYMDMINKYMPYNEKLEINIYGIDE